MAAVAAQMGWMAAVLRPPLHASHAVAQQFLFEAACSFRLPVLRDCF